MTFKFQSIIELKLKLLSILLLMLILSSCASLFSRDNENSNTEDDNTQESSKNYIEPLPDEFIPCEKEPVCDLKKIQKKIVYPEAARKAGIEGKVIIRALVTKTGQIKKTLIEYSDSELLNQAALDAVKQMKCTPAIQKNKKIAVWISIPLEFRLKK